MYITTNRIPVSKGFEQQFEARFTSRPSHMPGVPGFIRNHLLRPADGGNIYVVMTFWQSKDAFEAWTKSEAFMQSHAGPKAPEGMYAGSNVFEAFEVIQTVE
jgi:heme-degrading monooxygenase HmoA